MVTQIRSAAFEPPPPTIHTHTHTGHDSSLSAPEVIIKR